MFGRTIPNSVVTEHNGRGRAGPDNELGRCKRSTYRADFMCRHKSASFTDRWSYAMSDTGRRRSRDAGHIARTRRWRATSSLRERIEVRRAIADEVISLANLLGRPVLDDAGSRVGKVSDIVVRWEGSPRPGWSPSPTPVRAHWRDGYRFCGAQSRHVCREAAATRRTRLSCAASIRYPAGLRCLGGDDDERTGHRQPKMVGDFLQARLPVDPAVQQGVDKSRALRFITD